MSAEINQVKFIFVSFFLLKKIIIYIFKFKSDEEDELNDFDNIVDSNDDHDLCSINYVSPFLSLSLSISLFHLKIATFNYNNKIKHVKHSTC